MNVIISNYDDLNNPYYAGGGAIAIHQVAKRLRLKFSVTVITAKYPGSKDEIVDNVSYKRIGLEFLGPKLGQLLFQLLLPYYVVTESYDVWLENFTPPFSTNFLQTFTKKPVIGLVHMLSGEDMRRKYKLPFYLVERIGLKTYQHLIVLTDHLKREIRTINPKAQIEVISNGIEVNQSMETKNSNKNYILFMGRIEVNQKGLDLLLQAFKATTQAITSDLIIAGSGLRGEVKKTSQLIHSLGLDNRVKLVGRISGQDKQVLFANALFTVIPSRFETFSLVAMESLAYKKTFVCFDIPGLSWVPQSACIKVKPYNKQSLSQALVQLSQNSQLRRRLSQTGYTFASHYSWEYVSQKYESYIYQVLKTSLPLLTLNTL